MSFLKLRSSDGFTLLESLIVISVVSIVLLFGVFSLNPIMELMQKRMFISQLESDLYYAQSHAINRKERVSIIFSRSDNRYSATGESSGILFNRGLQHSVKISGGSLNQLRLHITPEGTINNFGSVIFDLNNQTIELNFHIGRGRFVVKE